MELINLLLNMNQINYELLMHHWEGKKQMEHPPKQNKQKPEITGTTTKEISCKILVTNTQEK